MRYGGIEAGGTKFVCGIGDADGNSIETCTIPTAAPVETLDAVRDFFMEVQTRHGACSAFGIGSFGPLDLDPHSPGHGNITRTPKPGWTGINLARWAETSFGRPAAIDTDVNAAAIAESACAGAPRSLAYVTCGTGIGVGLVVKGQPLHGMSHPEAGHMLPRRHPAHDGFAGCCPYHGDCYEGLASGPAIIAAWGQPLSHLSADHPAWDVEAAYLGQLCATLILTVAPQRIVLGGGIMNQQRLYAMIRDHAARDLAGYIAPLDDPHALDALIVPPACAEPPGLAGAYRLAQRAAARGPSRAW